MSGFADLLGRKILGERTAAKFSRTVSEIKYSGLLCSNIFWLLCELFHGPVCLVGAR